MLAKGFLPEDAAAAKQKQLDALVVQEKAERSDPSLRQNRSFNEKEAKMVKKYRMCAYAPCTVLHPCGNPGTGWFRVSIESFICRTHPAP